MKKKIPASTFRSTPASVITVHSRAYGEHTRAARGSIKPARLNETLARRCKELGVLTAFAREVHNLLRVQAGIFKEAMFWQSMLSRLHTVTDISPVTMLKSLEGLELNSRHPLKRFDSIPFVHITVNSNCIAAGLNEEFAPYFNKPFGGYFYDMIVLFFSRDGKAAGSEAIRSRWLKSNEATGELCFQFPRPADSAFYLLCLRLHAGNDGVPINGITSQGMKIICSGELER